ncbi:hypothetical protein C1H46_041383 [Malus baccata]|uniref:Uncharacterized protein n=1 Tax=Malus baccata TaxID=106549 RepID=A0A540KFT1_MALBA|nr:hypothetical protein C1H46_041383 [Malus baccata]
MPMQEERPTASVFMLMNFIPPPFGGALYELKINQAGEVMEGETCGPLETVQWFFDPKKSSEFPAPVPSYIVLDGVRYGSPSKLYMLPIPGPDRDMVPDEDRHHLYTFDTETKSLEQIEGPRAFKRSSLLISAYGKLYNLTDPASFPFMTNPSFECYDPNKGIWEPLNPFPKYGEKTGLSYVEVMGYAVCYGCILISMYGVGPSEFVLFHIASETWHPVYIPRVDDDMTGTKPYPSFVGRAVVVNDVIYATSTVSGVIISFSLGMDSDPSGRILFTVKNLFKFPERLSFIEWDITVSESLVHLGELRFCLLQTFKGRDFQPLQITTLEIVNDGSGERCIKTLCSVVHDVDVQISGGLELGYCFAPQFNDLEPEEDNKCQAAMVQWAARRRGKTKENNKFIRQFDDFELSRDSKAQLEMAQQWLARQRSKTNENNSNSTPEVLEPNVGETNKLAKNFESKEEETDKSTKDIVLKEDETDMLAKDFEPKEEGTDKQDKKGAEVSRGAAKKKRKRNKKKKLAGRTGGGEAYSMPMEEERHAASVFMLMNFIPRPFGAALYELKINQVGEIMEGETCGPLEPVHWFFDPKKSSEFPVPVPDYIILDGVRYGSPSKLYLLPIPGRDRDMVPDEERHYLYTFDTETKSLEQIKGPREFKRSSILISGYGKLYHLTDPASFPLITNPSFECYNPKKDIWEPLNPFPKYGQKTGPSYVEVMGYAVCYGCILISLYGFGPSEFVLFHIASETWHPVYVPTVDDDMTGTKPYPSFVGRAVIVNDVIYAASTVSGVILSFSLGMASDPSGRILFTVKNLFRFPEFTSFLELDNTVTESLVHLWELRFCLLQTVFRSSGRGFQPLHITTLEIVNDGSGERCIKTLCSVVRDIDVQISGGFELGYCFTPQFKDFEPEEDNKCQAAMVQWAARRRGKTKENNKFIRQFDEFELSGDKKVQLKLVQQWLARERSKMKEKNSNSKPEVLEPNAGETNKLTKNSNAGETNKLAKNFGSKEEETDKSTEDVIHKEDETDELDKKRAEVSRSAAKKRRKRNKKKKLAGRTGASVALLSFLSGLYMGAANLPGLVSRRVMDGLVSRFTSLLPRRVIGWLSA